MLKEIDLAGAMTRLREGSDKVYMLISVTKDSYMQDLLKAEGFAIADRKVAKPAPAPRPVVKAEKKKVDHGKIIALHNAGWTATAIASEVGCSIPTVTSHIKAEKEKSE